MMARVSQIHPFLAIGRRRTDWCVLLVLWASFTCFHRNSVEAALQRQTPGTSPGGWNRQRGGGSEGDDSGGGSSTPPLEETENSTENSEEEVTTETPKRKLWAPGALFELNDEIKSDLTKIGDDGPSNESNNKNNVNADESTHANQRGGALVKAAKPRRFQWLAPLDTKRVAPAHSRLLIDDQASEEVQIQKAPTVTKEPDRDSRRQDDTEVFPSREEGASSRETAREEKPEPTTKLKHTSHHSERGTSLTEERAHRRDKAREERSKQEGEVEVSSDSSPAAPEQASTVSDTTSVVQMTSPYVSSGYWRSIDGVLTLGYASSHPAWRVSSRLRGARKLAAKYTGLHGVLSGKKVLTTATISASTATTTSPHHGVIRRRLAAIDRARRNIPGATSMAPNRGLFGARRDKEGSDDADSRYAIFLQKSAKAKRREARRKERVKEIDRLCVEAQSRLQQLACEKDMLQRRPNPLWNYTTVSIEEEEEEEDGTNGMNATANTTTSTSSSKGGSLISASRTFNFPPKDLVDEYLDMLFLTSRLVKLNYTDLWRNPVEEDDEDELIDDDWDIGRSRKVANGQSNGNWLLRNGVGEKIGQTAERLAYNAVCRSIMSILARSLSSIHGANVMTFSDIRLSVVEAPNLPPVSAGIIPGGSGGSNYAKQAIANAMHRGARKNKKRRNRNRRRSADHGFIQRDAVVETMLSHCQISAPLLKMFPLAWQRALLSNIITLITAVIADFCEGLEFQILGHKLLLSFTPLTEDDVLRGMTLQSLNRKRAKPTSEFEAAVKATANDLSRQLNFLDRWHERALGSGMLRSQIANLIARLVLTLIDDVLGGARMDLWATHAGGPRLVAGLEYRTTPNYMGGGGEDNS